MILRFERNSSTTSDVTSIFVTDSLIREAKTGSSSSGALVKALQSCPSVCKLLSYHHSFDLVTTQSPRYKVVSLPSLLYVFQTAAYTSST